MDVRHTKMELRHVTDADLAVEAGQQPAGAAGTAGGLAVPGRGAAQLRAELLRQSRRDVSCTQAATGGTQGGWDYLRIK